jgi:hypothetical protein
MSTIDTTAQTADSNCYGAHPSHSGTKRKPPWDRRVLLSANGAMSQGPARPPFPRSSLRSSNNSKRRHRKRYTGLTKWALQRRSHHRMRAWPFGLERFTSAPMGTGGCSLTTPVLVGYSSGMSLIFLRAAKWPTLSSEPSSLQLAMGQRSKNSSG